MKLLHRIIIPVALLLLQSLPGAASEPGRANPGASGPDTTTLSGEGIKSVNVFSIGEAGSKYYRIPAICRAADGSLIAVADQRRSSKEDISLHPEGIRLVAKISHDNGLTWGELFPLFPDWKDDAGHPVSHGDAALALFPPTGDLVCVFCAKESYHTSDPHSPGEIYVSTSSDNGQTWKTPFRIDPMLKAQIDSAHARAGSPLRFFTGFGASGNMLSCPEGVAFVMNGRHLSETADPSRGYEYVCLLSAGDYSAMKWTVTNPAGPVCADGSGNESKIILTGDNRLMMSIRTPGDHRFAFSDDFGATWSEPAAAEPDGTHAPAIPEPGCNGGFLRYTDENGGTDRLYLSVPSRLDEGVRSDVTLYYSDDGGSKWHRSLLLVPGPSAYSTLRDAGDGRIGCLLECGDDISGYDIRYLEIPVGATTSAESRP